jgi:phosphoglycerate dehydrogenase-like enzyme
VGTEEVSKRGRIVELRVLLDGEWPGERLLYLESLLRNEVTILTDRSSVDYNVLVSGRPDADLITGSACLTHLLLPWAGLPRLTRLLMMDHPDISVHNIHHNADSVAELALGLMIAAARLIIPADRELRKGDWSWRYRQEGRLIINGSRVLILGYGHIGRRVGRASTALGASVTALRRSTVSETFEDGVRLLPAGSLHRLLPETDVLVLSLPLTDDTKGIMGGEQFGLLHERSVLVNIGRGELVDEDALYRSLSSGSIGAAGIDVWYRYPESEEERTATMPSRHDLASLDNIVMTPHMGGCFGAESLEMERARQLARSINALASGGSMPCRVDVSAGY